MRRPDLIVRPGATPPAPGRTTSRSLLALLTLAVLLFALITWQVAVHGPLARADERLSGSLVHPSRAWALLADLGSIVVAVPVLVAALVYVGLRARRAGTERWWREPVGAGVLMAAVPAIVVPMKELVARSGPPVMGPGTGFYPSGHTATAVVAYGSATLLLLPWLRGTLARRLVLAGCLGLNAAVAVGLVVRGFHWPLDVLASWCLCGALLILLRLFVRSPTPPLAPPPPPSSSSPPSR
ncbi:phosphatase PAP2 family protein [Streptomyces sp. WI04-05B]|uniref:phosphatase PAP2 family protein n=1 Tax=Streptomyces TaxID=1883 RepID=UPI0029AB1223|nr:MULTISPECIES: phosphatase PAP2 family protein [unclassified Streptomyces]MDX2541997.1 phosphatase PAP2 family protein [Streptomyces sp. WI04-05B]MDX2587079.1 phosphatase PAP2 family protein [Streptomyces sp. WI04-05A]